MIPRIYWLRAGLGAAVTAQHALGERVGQRGAADTGDSIAPTVYGQDFKGAHWYDATGGTGADPACQSNLYP